MKSTSVGHPANAGLQRYLEPRMRPGFPSFALPDEVERPQLTLGTHPDLVDRLWTDLGSLLPVDCRAVYFGTPALVHPATGIVFAFAGGTHTYAFRLPEANRLRALQAGASRVMRYADGSSLDLSDIGDEWMLGSWLRSDEGEWCQAAYAHAGEMPAPHA